MAQDKDVSLDEILNQVVGLIKETCFRAKLVGKPFVLGLLVERDNGQLMQTLRKNISLFKQMGATEIDWRDDGLRAKAEIAGEELFVSVQGVRV